MTSEVFFTDMRAGSSRSLLDKLEQLYQRAGFDRLINPGELVAVKIHFGERGNLGYIRPQYLRRLVQKIKAGGGKPFLTDANTLYVGSRSNAVDHLQTAIENGFAYAVVEAPLVIADGLNGKDFVNVRIDQKHFSSVKIGSAIHYAQALIAVTHFKGHELTGFGGTLKNLGMGSGSRGGKQAMHSDVQPKIRPEKCLACGTCIEWCPAEAISIQEVDGQELAVINHEKCIGCGECTVTCPVPAIRVSWKTTTQSTQEKIAEYALGVLKPKAQKAGFISFLTDISPDCDCFGWNDAPMVADIGILASLDPVAIDQAAVDLVNRQPRLANSKAAGKIDVLDHFRAAHDIDWSHQLAYAEQIGLGSRSYKLIQI
ncbi:MAG: DUF362 domain-containing protein [Syntrophomonadaceae bacterium]|nr:DUF362 domain-containing protein [Syntrophomonadaceae bacterium]